MPIKSSNGEFTGWDVINIVLSIFKRYILTFIAFIMLIWFVFPLFIGVCDIGNIIGIIVCTAYIIWSRNLFLISALHYYIQQKKVGKIILGILHIFITVFIIYAIVVSIFMGFAAAKQPPNTDTTLVLLGCKVNGDHPSKSLRRRLEAAYDYLYANPAVPCIVTGGQGSDETMTEAQCMYQYLIENGIDKERIFMENKAKNTKENILFSLEIIKDRGLSSNITIATDGYHQLRSNIVALKNKVTVIGAVSANTPLEVAPTYWVREWAAIPVEIIRNQ